MAVATESPEVLPLRAGLFERDAGGAIVLLGSRCEGCGTVYFPPHALCVRCLTAEGLRPITLSRRGTVYTYTVVHQSTPEFPTPYVLAYVDLPEGVRVLSQLTEVAPEQVRIGMAVELVEAVVPRGDGPPVLTYRFRPAEEVDHG